MRLLGNAEHELKGVECSDKANLVFRNKENKFLKLYDLYESSSLKIAKTLKSVG